MVHMRFFITFLIWGDGHRHSDVVEQFSHTGCRRLHHTSRLTAVLSTINSNTTRIIICNQHAIHAGMDPLVVWHKLAVLDIHVTTMCAPAHPCLPLMAHESWGKSSAGSAVKGCRAPVRVRQPCAHLTAHVGQELSAF